MTYLEGQIEATKARITYWQTSIVSGHYKTRKIYHGTAIDPSKLLTQEELLTDAMSILESHMRFMGDLIEKLSSE